MDDENNWSMLKRRVDDLGERVKAMEKRFDGIPELIRLTIRENNTFITSLLLGQLGISVIMLAKTFFG